MTTEHDNNFSFNASGLTAVTFIEKDHDISSGQPYSGVNSNGNTITIKAGRHKTTDVATWFLDKTAGGGVIAKTWDAEKPSELSFAVRGTLTLIINGITYTSEDIILALGNYESNNNWWIGSASMCGVTWHEVNQDYAVGLVNDSLSLAADIVSEDPVGAVIDSAKIVVDILTKSKVGSGMIAFKTSDCPTAVELLLFQMGNSDTAINITGNFTHP